MARGATAWLRHHIPRNRVWRLVDARGQVLGRMASQIARMLIGKHKPTFVDNIFSGDPVVVINARHFALTGRKHRSKHYVHHTGYPGGRREIPVQRVLENRPEDPIRLAVKRMLASNKLRGVRLANLHIYPEEQHAHEAQNPVLMPPAGISERLGRGGPPTMYELENWWLDHMCLVPDHILRQVVDEVRGEYAHKGKGLAELLDPEQPDTTGVTQSVRAAGAGVGPELGTFLSNYVEQAEQAVRRNPEYPVILPQTA